jgi:hypothetical protein
LVVSQFLLQTLICDLSSSKRGGGPSWKDRYVACRKAMIKDTETSHSGFAMDTIVQLRTITAV